MIAIIKGLPDILNNEFSNFIESAKKIFGEDLRSIILYGSGAEDKLRSTSDINIILVLKKIDKAKLDLLQEPFKTAKTALKLSMMIMLDSEIKLSAESFSVKFFDIINRHKVLYGDDVFKGVEISRRATINRLRQVLLNLSLRLREQYVSRGFREEQVVLIIADFAGPIRACASTIVELTEKTIKLPKEALEQIVKSFQEPGWDKVLNSISQARETRSLIDASPNQVLFKLMELTQRMLVIADNIS